MKLNGDYHTHTVYSHGLNTIEENVKAAIAKGLKFIAITEHGYGHLGFGVKKEKLKEMKNIIVDLNAKYDQIEIKFGIEANILGLDGSIDLDDELEQDLDILLCGYHFGSNPKVFLRDIKMHFYNILSKYSRFCHKRAMEHNTIAIINALNRYDIDVLTHPGAKGPIDIELVAKAAFANNTLLEINSSHGHLTVSEILRAKTENVKFIINSDAHSSKDVGNCSKGIERALKAGLTEKDIYNADL